jgi:hypothetical protein
MNAMGHVLCASADPGLDSLWDLCDEMAMMVTNTDGAGVGVHSLPEGLPRYCIHPTGEEETEIRHDDLREGLMRAAVWLAGRVGDDYVWRRG